MPKKKKQTKTKKTKKPEFIRFNTIKEYISDSLKLRSTDKTVKQFIKRFDSAIEATLEDAGKSAKKTKRKTIMNKDTLPALEKQLGKKFLTWQEISGQILKLSAADLGKMSKAINTHLGKKK